MRLRQSSTESSGDVRVSGVKLAHLCFCQGAMKSRYLWRMMFVRKVDTSICRVLMLQFRKDR